MADIKALQQSVKRRNLLAVCFITILISATIFSIVFLFEQQDKNKKIIDIANNQRVLSQQIALHAYHHYYGLTLGKIDENNTKNLLESVFTFTTNQQFLADLAVNQPKSIPPEVYELFFSTPINLNSRVKVYGVNAIKLSKIDNLNTASAVIQKEFERDYVNNLLINIDLMSSKIERHINQRNSYIQVFESRGFLVTLVLLTIVGIFIFRPSQRIIRQNYQELFLAKQQSAELKLALDQHAIVYRINMDKQGTITSVNPRFLEFYRYTEQEIIGTSVFDICGERYPTKYYEEVFQQCLLAEYWHGESINKIKGGRELWLNTTIVPLMNTEDKIESFIVIQNDISGIKQTELALNKLHQITSDVDKVLDDKIRDILVLGKQIFNLPLALISEIHDQEYRVVYCHTPNQEICPGDKFELGNTYCFHTLKSDHPIAFHQAGLSEIKDHPCYQAFALESYIGVPLVVDGKRFGTLNFSGSEPSFKPFNDRELELIQLFAYWISAELTRANQQNKLLAQQSLMEQMGQQARIGAWEVDLVNDTLYWSSMTKEIHEVSEDYQPKLATAINFYKEGESRDTIDALVAKSIEDGSSYEQELQLVTAKGNEIWVSARGRSEFENGKCIRLFGSFQDITEKMTDQHKISAHNQRISLATDSAGIGIWELDLITDELKWDEWMFKVYGITPKTFSGAYEAWENGLHPDDKEESVNQLNAAIEGYSKFDTQFRIVWPNGEIKHIKAAAFVSYDADKTPISMVGVNYDVTELVENEIALLKAKEEAEIAVTAKNEFFASMSHEIRTPMNGVIGMLDLVRESQLDQEQKHRISIAQKSAKSLLSLINDILDFSKIDANKLELENVTFNLRKMVGDLAEAFAQQAQQKNLELIVDLVDVKESLIKGDSNRIRQILTNLVANAVKFTKHGEVVIRLSQESYSISHWKIIVCVSDTGIGISKNKQAQLFEAFSQVDASTTREYGGTGLGLAIVKKLSQCMQGTVRVENNEGAGSVFICELLIEKSPDSLLSLPNPATQGKRVLVVEDNYSCGDAIKRQLMDWKLVVDIIPSGKQALMTLTTQPSHLSYDLVIINQQIPDVDAVIFVKELRTYPSLSSIKIQFMTLMASQHDLGESEYIGLDGYFPKPVTTFDLHRVLNTLVDNPEKQLINPVVEPKITSLLEGGGNWMQDVKLLLVEDNRVNQMVAMGVLNKIGIGECIVAVNGNDAIEKLISSDGMNPFNFIFMDCQMPEMDGYQATQLIREGKAGIRYKNIPIVAMTANAMVGDEQKCLAAGMDDYLAKPIDKDLVLKRLQRFLG